MKYKLLIITVFFINLLFGQTLKTKTSIDCLTKFDSINNRIIYITTDTMPEFPGGIDSMLNFINNNLKWPKYDEADFQGTVYISFIVESDGSLSNKEILKGIYVHADEEAMKLLNKMPKWKAGKCKGIEVPVRCILPIKFLVRE